MANRMPTSYWCLILALSACHARSIGLVDCASGGDCGAEVVDAGCTDARVCGSAANATLRPGTAIIWDGAGTIVGGRDAFDMHGGWWKSSDCSNVEEAVASGRFVCPEDPPTPNCCTAWDESLVGPDLEPGWSVTGGIGAESPSAVCVKGTTSQVLNDVNGVPAFDVMWGSSLALVLNDWMPYDASRAFPGGPITGFSFDLEGPPSRGMRIGVVLVDTFEAHFKEFFEPTRDVTLRFDELEQGDWVADPVPLDLTKLWGFDFHFAVSPSAPTPFEVCVSNLRVLQ